MSIQQIQQYYAKVERIKQYGGTSKETTIRKPFQDLLEHYARQNQLELIAELPLGPIRPDGTLKDALRQDWGYWESKDADDDLDSEIAKKFAKGYPQSNILFEDSQTAVLIQNGKEVGRVSFHDAPALDALLTRFIRYENSDLRQFRESLENFSRDVPLLAETLRQLIAEAFEHNLPFSIAANAFLALCHTSINTAMSMNDVREMIVQHILTEDIFITIFNEPQFHRENNIAHTLAELVSTFYKGAVRRTIDSKIGPYTQLIKARASQIANHHEKQKFLKVLYETFYKAYNPKAADRLGIVYTPNEIVRFMIEAADYLCFQHFEKTLGDKGVEILDPATGTGTFITELIEYLPKQQLQYKYEHELHCNEVSILPYYIANLNIEYSYKQKMGEYRPFENILFVDTLDNIGFNKAPDAVYQPRLGFSFENAERIKEQNKREISIIIGNPPYNTNQLNENENNKNRPYPEIDKRIKESYIKHSTAQKTKLYDMYTRFFRWSSDRLHDNGIIAFITNRSFLEACAFDGFRKVMAEEFSHIYIIDLGGDVRKNPKLSGPKHNVFAIQTGVAITLMVRKQEATKLPCRILYARRPELETAADKLGFLAGTRFSQVVFERIRPSRTYEWLNIPEHKWDDLISLENKTDTGLFYLHSLGVSTNRDEWVYDLDKNNLEKKIRFFIDVYNNNEKVLPKTKIDKIEDQLDYTIKWSSSLKSKLLQHLTFSFQPNQIIQTIYRPYTTQFYYSEKGFSDRLTANHFAMFGDQLDQKNKVICCSGASSSKPFQTLAINRPASLDFLEKTQCFPLYRYDQAGNRVDNITDWGLKQFQAHYQDENINKIDIFHYLYAVLHHSSYRQMYELNLKCYFPRIPFYGDFWKWEGWGRALMGLHLDYETVSPYPLEIEPLPPVRTPYKTFLRAESSKGSILLDNETRLNRIPPLAWEYKLGNRSALEWVLDRYKERTPQDPTVAEKFNTYRFLDYKEQVIDLLQRVTTVSVQTMEILHEMSTHP